MNHHPPVELAIDPAAMGPVTDLYQLTMMAGYAATGKDRDRAIFEVFVRKLPPRRSYLIFAGLEQAIGSLLSLRFDRSQVEELRRWPVFASVPPGWFDQLLNFRFDGDVWAIPEGTVIFPGEPLVRVEAPLAQAQLVETMLLATLGYATLVASKAARIVTAAEGRGAIDFGARRGHGLQASFIAARAAYIAGFDGTSQVEAARRLQIPAMGTMAHSWVQAFDSEHAAFEAFSRCFPNSTLLVDTYDTREGVIRAAAIEPPIRAIRIDSGDLQAEATRARRLLDDLDRRAVQIVASGDLDEDAIAQLVANGAPIDQFGVGTELITSGGAPAISMVYKLVECNGVGRIKKSAGKHTYPLAKQVWRHRDGAGKFCLDQVTQSSEIVTDADPLLERVVADGQLAGELPDLNSIRAHCGRQIDQIPDDLRALGATGKYPLIYSAALQAEAARLGLI